MDISFSGAALAALCSSERRLADRWGADAGRTVGRRLLELAAADAGTVGLLPRAAVSVDGDGETVIDFGGEVLIRGLVSSNGQRGERIVITSVHVQGRSQP